MISIEELKNNLLKEVKSKYEVYKLTPKFNNEFYYPNNIHLLKFDLEQYFVKNLGNIAILQGSGLKVMNMITIVITPTCTKDIPFVIIDFIKTLNKITVFVEFYSNHLFERDNLNIFNNKLQELQIKYSDIENYEEEPNWYTYLRNEYSPLKKGGKKDYNILCDMVIEYLNVYLTYCYSFNYNSSLKNIELLKFIDNLIYKGNPSTVVLEKALGKDETIRLFKDIIFFYDGR